MLYITLAVAAIFLVAFFKRRSDRRAQQPAEASGTDAAGEDAEPADLNEKFLSAAEGRPASAFVRTYASKDTLLIRSLLDAEGIGSYVGGERVNALFPGLMIQNYTDSAIVIFDDERERARPIVEDYIRNLIAAADPDADAFGVDFAAVLLLLPTSLNQILPEILENE